MAAVDYEQLAAFYDRLVTYDDDVAFFVDLSRRAPGKVLELMAGTGRLSVPIASDGVSLTCVDRSPAMLRELRRKLRNEELSSEVVEQDVTRLNLDERFALAFLAFNSFEELTEDADRDRLLKGVFAHLVDNGRFVCTLHDPEVHLREVGPGHDRQWRFEDDDGRRLLLSLRTTFSEERRVVQGRQVLRDLAGGEPVADLPLRYRLTSEEEFRSLALQAGFTVETVYGGFDREPYAAGQSSNMVWVLGRTC
jgi:SAM-dependent methyltransferase